MNLYFKRLTCTVKFSLGFDGTFVINGTAYSKGSQYSITARYNEDFYNHDAEHTGPGTGTWPHAGTFTSGKLATWGNYAQDYPQMIHNFCTPASPTSTLNGRVAGDSAVEVYFYRYIKSLDQTSPEKGEDRIQ